MPRNDSYDVVIVGARVAGAATAMLLAREGLRVLAIERASYGSDTLSTHAMLSPGVRLLADWGILKDVIAAGTPPIGSTVSHYEDGRSVVFDLSNRPLFAPRRTVLDRLLVDEARNSGAEVIFNARALEIQRHDDGAVGGVVVGTGVGPAAVRAPLLIGADGVHSFIARSVSAPVTHQSQYSAAAIMAYFEGSTHEGSRWDFARHSSAGRIPTNNGLNHVFVSVSRDRFRSVVRNDIATSFDAILTETAPDLAEFTLSAKLASRFRSFPGILGFTKRASGPGWALVGDAGAFADPMAAHGMSAALRDAVLCAEAAQRALEEPRAAVDAWESYESARDEIAVPFIDAIDVVTAYRHDMDTIQKGHIELSKLIQIELDLLGVSDRTAAA